MRYLTSPGSIVVCWPSGLALIVCATGALWTLRGRVIGEVAVGRA